MNTEEVVENTEVEEVEETEQPVDLFKAERNRYQYYGFLRRRNKPSKGNQKTIKFPPMDDKEDINDYFARCHKTVGARPAPIGPMKKQPVNSSCICKSGKKFKKCCGRGL
jgi:hypothetical protein